MQEFLQYLKSKSFVKNFIGAAISVIILVFIIFYSLSFYTKHGEGVTIPMLKNLPIEKAIQLLEKEGLEYQIDSVYVSNKVPGVVIDSDPDYQSFVKKGRTIYLTINTTIAPNVNFPDIEFKSFKEAQVILNNYGLQLGDTSYISDVSRDVVLEVRFANTPLKKDQLIPKGSKIDLILGNGIGNSEIEIPNLIGLSKSEALFVLKGSTLSLGAVTYNGSITDTINAKIISQQPAINDSVKTVTIGSPISITLGNK